MLERSKIIYIPSLRMKKGELEGIRALRGDVADCVLPLLIVPPAAERESGSQIELFSSSEAVPDVGGVLLKYWPRRQIFIDPTFLLKEHGAENASDWLPEIFKRARNLDIVAIPTVSLGDLEMNVEALRDSLSMSQKLKFGLRILSGDMTDPNLKIRIQTVLSAMDLATTECAIFADFSDADLSDPSLVTPIIQSALEQLQDFGQWRHIVFLGTHYPDKNPADPGQTISHPRNEWRAWRDAVKFDPSTADHMVFGDFAADCAKMDFAGKGGRPIPHCRYTTESHWLVIRGQDSGSQYGIMKDVYDRVLNSGQFSGASFSEADEYIYDVARDKLAGAGNAATWRQVNTTHHITRVVSDIAKVRGITITAISNEPNGAQLALLDDVT